MTAMRTRLLGLSTLLALLAHAAGPARGRPLPGPGAVEGGPPSALGVEATPIFREAGLLPGGWGEMLVRVSNRGSVPAGGEVVVSPEERTRGGSRAPFVVAPGASVSLRVPARIAEYDDPHVRVLDRNGAEIYAQSFRRPPDETLLLVDVSQASALGAALRRVPVGARYDPWSGRYGVPAGYAGSRPLSLEVASLPYDPATGDPVLPEHLAGYARAAAVLLRSDELCRLGHAATEALGGFVLGGGTLAVVVARPEDLRQAVVRALVGGEAAPAAAPAEARERLVLPEPGVAAGSELAGQLRPVPRAAGPEAELAAELRGFVGGNLRPSLYGASAGYGLGEVHLLGFDPQRKPAVDSAWAQARMVDLVRRAAERRSTVLLGPGGRESLTPEIRRQLDPNEASRWAILVAALVLCLYSVVAGPVSFSVARKRGRPLAALVLLPLFSAAAFLAVVGAGFAAKGCSGRARHLDLVEAGAGMKVGVVRRWRGFFVPGATDLVVRASHAGSVLGTQRESPRDGSADKLLCDRDGARLVDLALRPWQTVVVREDGLADLGAGIALVKESAGETHVVNRTGRRLLGLVLSQPGAGVGFLAKLDDAAGISSRAFRPVAGTTSISAGRGGLSLVSFQPHALRAELDGAASGLTAAWLAVLDALPGQASWFPADVPVLLAQIEGGEGRSHDAGLRVDSDRLLVRVVGYGGEP
ncbi:MAG: hypothetical protein HY744_24015 [Deltaproteobacteria bacterium]|nr:hypothetical protein [Deltaproteobacteria bacterium]